jgi:glycosyltransferase involved in cell wall biosynthesis
VAGNHVHVSVVVPTCNRAELIVRLIDSLGHQDMTEPFEVVVVDDRSTDDTLERLRTTAQPTNYSLKVLPSEKNTGPAGARNRGWQEASGDLIAFIDDDCVPTPGWLAAIAAGLAQADIAIGQTRPPADQLQHIGPFSNFLDIDHNQSFSTCNIGYRRAVLEKMGGFDAEGFAWLNGEDTDLGLRSVKAGFHDAYVPEALVWHDVAESRFLTHFRRARRLEGMVALVARHPEARQNLQAGWFLRSNDKAVLIAWGAALALGFRPQSKVTRLAALVAAGLYVWQFDKAYFRSRSPQEWAKALPLAFAADSWTVFLMIRSSARYRALLL